MRRERAGTDRRRVLVHLADAGRRAFIQAGDPAVSEGLVTAAVLEEEIPELRRHLRRARRAARALTAWARVACAA